MLSIEKCSVPPNSLLAKYSSDGSYADCYATEIPRQVSFPEFIFAFYTTLIFKLERFILKWLASKPSTDVQARQLAEGGIENFAAWHVENRRENEILMCDFHGRTRSWLMVTSASGASTTDGARTCLYFGSAVVPVRNPKTGELSLGFGFQALLGFHKAYSVLLLFFCQVADHGSTSGSNLTRVLPEVRIMIRAQLSPRKKRSQFSKI